MNKIPAGYFLQGSTEAQIEYLEKLAEGTVGFSQGKLTDEIPQHSTYLDTFWLDIYEVTNVQFSEFVESSGYITTAENKGKSYVWDPRTHDGEDVPGADWRHPEGPQSNIDGRSLYPVVHISWDDANAFCEWAEKRLPTEAEWEKAARGTEGSLYSWGNEWHDMWCNHSIEVGSALFPVGSFPNCVSPYGNFDLLGNVFEWVADWYDPNFYNGGVDENPQGPEVGVNRVRRGGSWGTRAGFIHAAWRNFALPESTSNTTGFRCASDSR